MSTQRPPDLPEDGEKDIENWLLENRRYLRSLSDASGDGTVSVTLPIDECRDEQLSQDDDVVVLPSDLAGQLGLRQDPVFEVYSLPLQR